MMTNVGGDLGRDNEQAKKVAD